MNPSRSKMMAIAFLWLLVSLSRVFGFCKIAYHRTYEKGYFPTPLCSSSIDSSGSSELTTNSGIQLLESAFRGAGEPRPDLAPEDIPTLLMEALSSNDFPDVDSGLRSVWAFAGATTRHIFQNNYTDFVQSAHETADQFSTSFYGNAFHGVSWEMETPLNRVGGDTASFWIATQVMKTVSNDGRVRRWQWELRKNRRPPNLGCWFIETIGSSDRKGEFEAE